MLREAGAFYDADRKWLTATTGDELADAVAIARESGVREFALIGGADQPAPALDRWVRARVAAQLVPVHPARRRRSSVTTYRAAADHGPWPPGREFRLIRSVSEADENRVSRWARIAMYAGVVHRRRGCARPMRWSTNTRGRVRPASPGRWRYVALLCLAAYSVGLPEQPSHPSGRSGRRRRRDRRRRASSISGVQLFAGDALLPRFVVLGSVVVLVPWFVLCAASATTSTPAPVERDRVRRGRDRRRESSAGGRSRPRAGEAGGARRMVVAARGRRRSPRDASAPLVDMARDRGGDGRRAGPCGAERRRRRRAGDVIAPGRARASARCRCSTSSGWARSRITELERVSLLFDIGELHAAGYARVKRLLDTALASCGLARARAGHAVRARRQPGREPGPLLLPAARVSVGTVSRSRS